MSSQLSVFCHVIQPDEHAYSPVEQEPILDVKYNKQDQQGKAAFNERNPNNNPLVTLMGNPDSSAWKIRFGSLISC
jgi:hypothetical protein